MISSPTDTQPAIALDDSGAGHAMFAIFTTAVLIVTASVALLALVGTWWMLGVVFAVDLLATTVVVTTIIKVMDGRASANTDRAATESLRGETRSPAPTRPATAL